MIFHWFSRSIDQVESRFFHSKFHWIFPRVLDLRRSQKTTKSNQVKSKSKSRENCIQKFWNSLGKNLREKKMRMIEGKIERKFNEILHKKMMISVEWTIMLFWNFSVDFWINWEGFLEFSQFFEDLTLNSTNFRKLDEFFGIRLNLETLQIFWKQRILKTLQLFETWLYFGNEFWKLYKC